MFFDQLPLEFIRNVRVSFSFPIGVRKMATHSQWQSYEIMGIQFLLLLDQAP